ncbi:hypothetical protein HZC08_00560 [Candidatus Micrarchaeota archaeon]|nr:hypothetical protein [Candidatus Micrarchaeota archaeon]
MENVTLNMIYLKLQNLEQKAVEIETILETEHIHPITNKKAIEKLKKLDEEAVAGKRRVISEEEFFSKY